MKELCLCLILATNLTLVTSSLAAPAEKQPPSAKLQMSLGKIIDHLQESWDAAKSYEAAFDQEVVSKAMGGDPDHSAGTLYVIKPNKLRWDTRTDGGLQILNGKKLISIQENPHRQTREVDIWENASRAVDAKLLNFLSGKAQFKKLYDIKLRSESPKVAELKLVSKSNADESYIAEIDKSSYLLRSLTIDSVDSRTIIKFSDIKTNIPLKDSLFEYQKKSTDIVHKH